MPTVACFDGVFAHSLTHMVLQPLYNCRLLSCVTEIALPLNEKTKYGEVPHVLMSFMSAVSSNAPGSESFS